MHPSGRGASGGGSAGPGKTIHRYAENEKRLSLPVLQVCKLLKRSEIMITFFIFVINWPGVVDDIAKDAKDEGSIPRPVISDTAFPTARHHCGVSSGCAGSASCSTF